MSLLVSVIIPVYQTEKYLAACLDSVLAQTYRNLEILLVDDGSTDASPGICDAYAKKDPRICCIHQENAGAGAARNTGLRSCSGAWICFVDSDDLLAPGFVERLLSAAESTGAGIARGRLVRMFRTGETAVPEGSSQFCKDRRAPETVSVCDGKELVFRAIRESRECTIWASLYRRTALEGIWFDPEKSYEDLFFHAKAFGGTKSVALVPDAVYGYRRNPDSVSFRAVTRTSLDALAVREQRIGYLEKNCPSFVPAARLELAAEIVQIRVRMKKTEETPELGAALSDWGQRYPYTVQEAAFCALRPETRLILVLAKISLPGTVRLLKLRKRLVERRGPA